MIVPTPICVLALGASLTEGYCRGGTSFKPYTLRLQELAGPTATIVNRGSSGETTAWMRERLSQLLAEEGPFTHVVLLGGTNDIGGDTRSTEIVANLTTMYNTILAQPGTMLVAVTIPETSYEIRPSERAMLDTRKAVNQYIADYVATHAERARLVDLATRIPQHSEPNEVVRESMWEYDGLHLTADGYSRFGELVWEVLQQT